MLKYWSRKNTSVYTARLCPAYKKHHRRAIAFACGSHASTCTQNEAFHTALGSHSKHKLCCCSFISFSPAQTVCAPVRTAPMRQGLHLWAACCWQRISLLTLSVSPAVVLTRPCYKCLIDNPLYSREGPSHQGLRPFCSHNNPST